MRELEREAPTQSDTSAVDALPSLVVVGPGRTGRSIAAAARAAGLEVKLAGRDDAPRAARSAEVALLCVPDDAIPDACEAIAEAIPPLRLVGHVSGASALTALAGAAGRGAETFSLHPLQTIPDGDTDLVGVPAAIAGSSPAAEQMARRLAEALGMYPFPIPEELRTAYHAAACMASNFLVALEESASALLERAGVDDPRRLLAPLVVRTAANWAERGGDALTGPIARGDQATVEAHLAALRELAPELSALYQALAARTRSLVAASDAGGGGRTDGSGGVRVLRTRAALRDELAPARRARLTIGLVPTMGYLHEGHLSLLRAARSRCDLVVMSLFVNPTQFAPGEDFERYPRDEARDVELAECAGADLVYAPEIEEVYPAGFSTRVEVERSLTEVLCGSPGRRGPEHFHGVATVVAKLLNVVRPDVAFFGQKDAQQAIVIRRMVRDLDFPVEVEVLPTVREPDGLALSSRNSYLSPDERRRAAALSRALRAAEDAAAAGEASPTAVLAAARAELRAAGIEPEYLEARDAEDLSPATTFNGRPVLLAVAARVGKARLIDNVVIGP